MGGCIYQFSGNVYSDILLKYITFSFFVVIGWNPNSSNISNDVISFCRNQFSCFVHFISTDRLICLHKSSSQRTRRRVSTGDILRCKIWSMREIEASIMIAAFPTSTYGTFHTLDQNKCVFHVKIGNLSSNDGNANEIVTQTYNFVSYVLFCDYFNSFNFY